MIFAFFPCTYFECQSTLRFNGKSFEMKTYSTKQRLEVAKERHKNLSGFYELLCEMVIVCLDKEIPLVLENPKNPPHYLTTYWPCEPSIIDMDRTQDGDYYKKPTQYWFFNCSPENNLVLEPIDYVKTATNNAGIKVDGMSLQTARSMIHPQYASRFIKKYLIDYQTDFTQLFGGNND